MRLLRDICLLLICVAVPLPGLASCFDDVVRALWPRPAIKYRACPTGEAGLSSAKARPHDYVVAKRKQAWEQALGGQAAAVPYIQARLVGWPQRSLVDRRSLPGTESEFLDRLARDTWRGLDAFTDRDSGLPINSVRLSKDSVALADARIGDYVGGTDIGLHLAVIVAARDLDFISAADAVAKVRRVLDTLEHLETYRGFLFNYYDTTSLERTSNFVSFVDSSWLTAGLMVARMAFPELYEQCTRLIMRADFGLFYDRVTRQISHGYYVNPVQRSPFDYGMLYTEARLGSVIAMGKGDIPEDNWFAMVRTFPLECTGQTMTPQATRDKAVRGHAVAAGYYEWNGVRYVPSWGGSLFEALMPTLVLDEQRYAPKGLGANDRAHAEVQRQYALSTLGYPVWGLSSSATPLGDDYSEYGVRVLGASGYGAGAVTPHASALALGVAPQAAVANLRALARDYDIYGDYGLYDAVDPLSGAVAHKYLALDQSMLFIALANYLKPHCVQQHFAADPIMQRALPIIADEDFFD